MRLSLINFLVSLFIQNHTKKDERWEFWLLFFKLTTQNCCMLSEKSVNRFKSYSVKRMTMRDSNVTQQR